MIPVIIADIVDGLATAEYLWKIGFRKVSNPNENYTEFGEDIKKFSINLDILSNIIQRAKAQTGQSDRTSRFSIPQLGVDITGQFLGKFKETLDESERLLNEQKYFLKREGFVSIINWYEEVDSKVQALRGRIAVHNIKLSISLKSLDPGILKDGFNQVYDCTLPMVGAAEELGRYIHGEDGGAVLAIAGLGSVATPPELESSFATLTTRTHPDLLALPLVRGVDAVVYHFTKLSKSLPNPGQSQIRYLLAIITIMKAAWILQTVKNGQEYETATRYRTIDDFERQIDRWGMTIERFFDRFEETLYEASRRLLGRHLVLPPTPDLLEIFEKDKQMWPGEQENDKDEEPEVSELGKRILRAQLRSTEIGYSQVLQLYHQQDKRFNLVLIRKSTLEAKEKETTDGYDLKQVQLFPSYATRIWNSREGRWISPSTELQTLRLKTEKISPITRILGFQQTKDIFEFQQTVTGYKVVHDDSRVLTTCQESKMLGGSSRQDLCRLQLWSAPSPKLSSSNIQSPYLDASRRTSQTSFTPSISSNRSPNGSNLTLQNRRQSSSGMSIFSSRLGSIGSSRSSVVVDAPTLPDALGGSTGVKGGIYGGPVLPCVVLLCHRAPELGSRDESTWRSFLIVDIASDVTIEDELSESFSDSSRNEHRCVLERKGGYLPARRSSEVSDPYQWDLAVAGLHKRETGTEVVKKLKHVIIQFDSQNNMRQFADKFRKTRELAKLRLAKFVQKKG